MNQKRNSDLMSLFEASSMLEVIPFRCINKGNRGAHEEWTNRPIHQALIAPRK